MICSFASPKIPSATYDAHCPKHLDNWILNEMIIMEPKGDIALIGLASWARNDSST